MGVRPHRQIPSLLTRGSEESGLVNDVRTWQATMNDLRTALLEDPLPIEIVKNLLSDLDVA